MPGVSRISTTLVTRLVLNLRERARSQLPTTVETEGKFQAALPVARQPVSFVRKLSSFRPSRSTATSETVTSLAVGESRSQPRGAHSIVYEERRFQASLPVARAARQMVASIRSPSSVRSNRSTGETTTVGAAGASLRSADATGYETEVHLLWDRRRLTNKPFQF